MPAPGPGEARVRQTAIGVNFIDVYFRRGIYKAPQLPFTPGQEGAGVVEAVGPGRHRGRRRRSRRLRRPAGLVRRGADRAGRAPREAAAGDRRQDGGRDDAQGDDGGVSPACAARASARGDTILFHAAAGGVGSIACQWAKHLGLRVIGTAGGPDKAARARGARLRPRHRLRQGRRRRAREGADRRRGRHARCSTASASGRSTRRSPAWRRAGCWCCSASRPARCRPSIRPRWRARRCSSPGPRSSTTSATRDELVASATRAVRGRGSGRREDRRRADLRAA